MNIVFCADKGVLPGLHVAAYSLLDRMSFEAGITRFHLFSDALDNEDIDLLHQTLGSLKKPYSLELHRVDPAQFQGYPSLNGSWATYYRLGVPRELGVDRFLYVDADTLCDVDFSPLASLEMGEAPAGLVAEAPLAGAADRYVAEQLGNSPEEPYYNAGVCLVNRGAWIEQGVTESALEYLKNNPAHFWDQSALNIVLHGKALSLDDRYNTISNMRKNWQWLKQPYGQVHRLIHFLDYPKPWDLGAELIHPQYNLWRSVLEKTEMRGYRSWQETPARRFPRTAKAKFGYQKAIKDKLLFTGYSKGWICNVKGSDKTSI
jgi:lipopolysaccharide biosynthesis glycosyltransferase